jgi:hypothetical protein
MARMEFLRANLYNTTTSIKVDNNTDGAEFLFDKNPDVQYTTSGYTGSTTASTISIEFAQPTVLTHLILQNHNIRDWRVYYNSATANSLHTATGNSATSTYISFASLTVNSIQFEHIAGMSAVERSIGELIVSERLTQFERNPSVDDFRPTIDRKQIIHEMPDGGVVVYNIKNKYRANLSWEFITPTFRNTLKSIYSDADPLFFIPEPTSTSWDGVGNECLWVGDFDFRHSTNDKNQGHSGKIQLRQTPSR